EFSEHLLFSQSEYFIEHYCKTGEGQWLLQEYRDNEVEIILESVGVSLYINELYDGISFELV
ncbi:MAG: Uma2 family endonuclease, partial [Cyanobacteria bacterium P01_F01_bin.143]